jgi:hypothetical protein
MKLPAPKETLRNFLDKTISVQLTLENERAPEDPRQKRLT